MTTLRQKIILVLFSLVLSLLLLESALRISGAIYHSYRIRNEAQQPVDKDAIRILCLGDSFTFGVGAPKGYSYPEQLQAILNRNNPSLKFVVYNGAIPGGNSSQLLKRIDGLLQKFNPQIAVIMIGCNNEWIPKESNYFLFSSDKRLKLYLYRADYFLSYLRSYNLLKLIIDKLKINASFAKGKYAEAAILNNSAMPDKEEFEKLIESGNKYLENREVNLSEEAFRKAVALAPDDERGHLGLAKIYIHCKGNKFEYFNLATKELIKALKINPNNEDALNNLWIVYYRLGKNKEALKAIERYVRLRPQDEDNLSYFLGRGLPDPRNKEIFKRLLRYDLGNTIRRVKARKIKVILQGYGMPYPYNGTLKDIADEFRVPFVDNESVFSELISKDGFSWKDKWDPAYFAEDGHQNGNGYRVIAENVYRALQSELNLRGYQGT